MSEDVGSGNSGVKWRVFYYSSQKFAVCHMGWFK
jgi:hypothetical protein